MPQNSTNGSSKANEQTPLLKDQQNDGTQDVETEAGTVENTSNNQQNPVPLAAEPSTTRLWVILSATWIGVFLAALDTTIIATISGPITATFHSFSLFSWLASGYLIANAAVQPLSGKLTDIFGRRNGLLWANFFFALGTLICGLADRQWLIITGRVVAGIGGGCLNTITTFVASDLVPLRRRGLVQGLGNVFYGMGSGLGGVFGGWIADVWTWRAAFLVQVPLILLSAAVVWFVVDIPVKETDTSKIRRVDFSGAASLVLTLVLLLLGLNTGGNLLPWSSPLVYVPLALSAPALLTYLYIEDRVAAEPIIPVRLLLNRTVAAACLSNWFASMAFFSYLYYAPIYFQVLGHSATAAGARLIPSSLGAAVGSLTSGFIMRATGRYYALNAFFVAVLVASSALNLVVLTGDEGREWQPFVVFALAGLGYGALITITLLALISAVPHEQQAVITSASYAFRSTGSTLGISVSSAAFANLLKRQLWARIGEEEGAAEWISRIRDDLGVLQSLPEGVRERAVEAALEGLRGVWWVVLGMVVVSAGCSLGMRENVLYRSLERRGTR